MTSEKTTSKTAEAIQVPIGTVTSSGALGGRAMTTQNAGEATAPDQPTDDAGAGARRRVEKFSVFDAAEETVQLHGEVLPVTRHPTLGVYPRGRRAHGGGVFFRDS